MKEIVRVRAADDNHQVVTVESGPGERPSYRRTPCSARPGMPACPWRLDAVPGEYPAEAYRLSAPTTYDLARRTFGCHQAPHERAQTCAGFLLRGASDNLGVRMWREDLSSVHSDVPLYDNYRDMAIANGVDPDDPALTPCRGDRSMP
ncbi:DUF6283 family protein [Streptomyces sp. NBC_01304]|uniref:DUF6283 family protein n=1 Tax=Streptomyces sp. NBC_01304 TaxID=2903818 RepID=UPI002E0EFB09|nr:DUF6283 family protein [Streptomyces sp. NBC_01304]